MVSCSRLSVCFVWSYNPYISKQLQNRVTASGDQICFFFIVNIEKIKIRITKKTSTKVHRQNYYPGHVFSWVLLNARTTEPPTNRPLTIYPPTHRPTDHPTTNPKTRWINNHTWKIDNRNIFILQNTNMVGKTYS